MLSRYSPMARVWSLQDPDDDLDTRQTQTFRGRIRKNWSAFYKRNRKKNIVFFSVGHARNGFLILVFNCRLAVLFAAFSRSRNNTEKNNWFLIKTTKRIIITVIIGVSKRFATVITRPLSQIYCTAYYRRSVKQF